METLLSRRYSDSSRISIQNGNLHYGYGSNGSGDGNGNGNGYAYGVDNDDDVEEGSSEIFAHEQSPLLAPGSVGPSSSKIPSSSSATSSSTAASSQRRFSGFTEMLNRATNMNSNNNEQKKKNSKSRQSGNNFSYQYGSGDYKDDDDREEDVSFTILFELVGATHLPIVAGTTTTTTSDEPDDEYGDSIISATTTRLATLTNSARSISGGSASKTTTTTTNIDTIPFCVIHYGTKVIHQTRAVQYPKISKTERLSRALVRVGALFGGNKKNTNGSDVDQRNDSSTYTGGDNFDPTDSAETNNGIPSRVHKSLQNPVFTVYQNSLFTVSISQRDLDNNKPLMITLWAKAKTKTRDQTSPMRTSFIATRTSTSSPGKDSSSSSNLQFLGKIRITAPQLLFDYATAKEDTDNGDNHSNEGDEKRFEFPLVDELGRPMKNAVGATAKLAVRCRLASPADVAFCRLWNQTNNNKRNSKTLLQHNCPPSPSSRASHNYPPMARKSFQYSQPQGGLHDNLLQIWKEGEVLEHLHRQPANLVTELDEKEIQGATITAALTGTITPVLLSPGGNKKIRIKPYPNPDTKSPQWYMTKDMIKTYTTMPSTRWVQAGSRGCSYGRIYLEILSAHNLPNVDIGRQVGNETDAFCAVVYGDAMVQTDTIDDELSPHWMPWTQRAFVFNMQHPSHVLYLSVFGFKRNPLSHRPVGRVEINPLNFPRQQNATYNLEYNLYESSHAQDRGSTRGKIRLRMRIEVDEERPWLLAALKPPPAVYINVSKKKSLRVARYTACGEYDNEEKFSLQILQSYIDEIMQGYLRRILYAFQDSTRSLIFWRFDQFYLYKDESIRIGIPLYSFLIFVFSILVLEHPQLFPSILCFTVALIFLVQMQSRVNSPSPWRRCQSFGHYMTILLTGKSTYSIPIISPSIYVLSNEQQQQKKSNIEVNEGGDEMKVHDDALAERIENDRKFIEKKEAVEKEIEEIEHVSVDNKSKVIPVELLVVLGKVQNIVGGVCRFCRYVDSLVTWEESDLSFFITLALLIAGVVFWFIPWAFLFKWTGRILVILLLGPQNKLIDIYWFQKQPLDEKSKVMQMFAERMFQARCHQEEAGKLKAFRHVLFGKYSQVVPPLMWSPHQDYPLATSSAQSRKRPQQHQQQQANIGNTLSPKELEAKRLDQLPIVTGQQLYGKMIPRPKQSWMKNREESDKVKHALDEYLLRKANGDGDDNDDGYNNGNNNSNNNGYSIMGNENTRSIDGDTNRRRGFKSMRRSLTRQPPDDVEDEKEKADEGFEVTEMYDEEAGYVKNVLKPKREESLYELGVEVLNIDDSAKKFASAWRSIHNFRIDEEEDDDDDDQENDADGSSDIDKARSIFDSTKTDTSPVKTQPNNTTSARNEANSDDKKDIPKLNLPNLTRKNREDPSSFSPSVSTSTQAQGQSQQQQRSSTFVRLSRADRNSYGGQSTIDLGIEIADEIGKEAAFIQEQQQAPAQHASNDNDAAEDDDEDEDDDAIGKSDSGNNHNNSSGSNSTSTSSSSNSNKVYSFRSIAPQHNPRSPIPEETKSQAAGSWDTLDGLDDSIRTGSKSNWLSPKKGGNVKTAMLPQFPPKEESTTTAATPEGSGTADATTTNAAATSAVASEKLSGIFQPSMESSIPSNEKLSDNETTSPSENDDPSIPTRTLPVVVPSPASQPTIVRLSKIDRDAIGGQSTMDLGVEIEAAMEGTNIVPEEPYESSFPADVNIDEGEKKSRENSESHISTENISTTAVNSTGSERSTTKRRPSRKTGPSRIEFWADEDNTDTSDWMLSSFGSNNDEQQEKQQTQEEQKLASTQPKKWKDDVKDRKEEKPNDDPVVVDTAAMMATPTSTPPAPVVDNLDIGAEKGAEPSSIENREIQSLVPATKEENAAAATNSSKIRPSLLGHQSLSTMELGVEITDSFVNEAQFVQKTWMSQSSMGTRRSDDDINDDDNNDNGEGNESDHNESDGSYDNVQGGVDDNDGKGDDVDEFGMQQGSTDNHQQQLQQQEEEDRDDDNENVKKDGTIVDSDNRRSPSQNSDNETNINDSMAVDVDVDGNAVTSSSSNVKARPGMTTIRDASVANLGFEILEDDLIFP